MRVPAGDVEALVLDRLKAFFSSRTDIGDALTPLDLEARAFDAALRNAFTLSKRWPAAPPVEMESHPQLSGHGRYPCSFRTSPKAR